MSKCVKVAFFALFDFYLVFNTGTQHFILSRENATPGSQMLHKTQKHPVFLLHRFKVFKILNLSVSSSLMGRKHEGFRIQLTTAVRGEQSENRSVNKGDPVIRSH